MMKFAVLLRSVKLPFAFDGGKWKVDDAGNLVKDAAGNPIYINSANAEVSVKGDTIASLNAEARTNRERAETAEANLKKFEGITDPTAAIKALDTVSKLDQKKLIDAGEVDRVKADIAKQYDVKIADKDKRINELGTRLNSTIITNAFATSPFVKEKVAIPVDFAQSYFGTRFDIDDKNRVVAKDANGNVILSSKTMGEPASFDEALEVMIGTHPNKDSILKGDNHTGSGNNGAGGNTKPGQRVVKRSAFDAMSPGEQNRTVQASNKGEVVIAD